MKRVRQALWFVVYLFLATLLCLLVEWPPAVWWWLCDRGDDIADVWRLAGEEVPRG